METGDKIVKMIVRLEARRILSRKLACHTTLKMNYSTVFCAYLVTLCLVGSTPVYPSVPLKHLSPTDICLFMCNMCFDDMGQEMMECANNVCLAKEEFEMNLGLIKLGRTCKNYSKLDSFVFANGAE